MKSSSFNHLFFAFAAVFLLTWMGCCPDCPPDPGELPPDSDPQITLLEPSEAYTLAYRGESVQITFRLDDNEQLSSFWVEETWTSVNGTPYSVIDQVVFGPQAISGNSFPQQFTYTVPTSVIQDYTTVTLTAYVQDNKSKVASTQFRINVLPDSTSGTAFLFTDYDVDDVTNHADTIYSVLKGSKYYFSFITRSNTPSSPGNYDIGEVSPNPTFAGILSTPNQPGKDSTMVVTDASMFNYDLATYETIWQAYVTSNQIGDKTSALKAGDIVIVKMVTLPHFAVMRILEKNNVNGFLKFEYKYTHF